VGISFTLFLFFKYLHRRPSPKRLKKCLLGTPWIFVRKTSLFSSRAAAEEPIDEHYIKQSHGRLVEFVY
jgi:hypothetical protein